MFKTIIQSVIKGWKLTRISNQLDNRLPTTADELLANGEKKEKSLHSLFNLANNQEVISDLLNKYHIDESEFNKLYWQLLEKGAGQWVEGHYIAASSLVYYYTLKFILENRDKISKTSLVFSLLNYFETHATKEVKVY